VEQIAFDTLRSGALVLVDSAPIIYLLERHPKLAARFRPLFALQDQGRVRLAVSAITVAEVLTGPLRAGDEQLAARYLAILESWTVVALTSEIAVSAARIRASLGLKLPDAVQVASAIAINAEALVTHDRNFSRVKAIRVIS
jgi:predicted nucleic acid-binding protein